MIATWLRALRVKHWIKNFFVLAPFLASYQFGFNVFLIKGIAGFFLFSLLSSAVYLFNDVIDIDFDRLHPEKKSRPIAAGEISIFQAKSVSFLLASIALLLSFQLHHYFFFCLSAYAINNVLYTFWLKNQSIIDIISIAVGFVLRTYAGGFLVDVVVTNWMIASVFCLSLLLGFGKRRVEIENLQDNAVITRKVLELYDISKLNLLLGVSASITIVTYMLYSLAPETKVLHNTDNIIFTTPFVVYCVFRYLLKIQEKNRESGPVEIILHDKVFSLVGLLWLFSLLFIIHS
jgi:4-hydroxybenzoate polyprenyltransferase